MIEDLFLLCAYTLIVCVIFGIGAAICDWLERRL